MTDSRGPVGAPYEARFHPDGPSDMFAHTFEEMVRHVADAVVRGGVKFALAFRRFGPKE